MIPTECKMDWN